MNVATGEYDPHGSETAKDKDWATNTMKLGNDKDGINPAGEDKTHVNGVARSKDMTTLFSVDDFGLINAFNWPAPTVKDARSYCAHSEHVTRCMLSPDQSHIFTTGGEDKTLIQWKVTGLTNPASALKETALKAEV